MSIDDKFKEAVESHVGAAVILAGSHTDESHIEKVSKSLNEYKIPHITKVLSAHKQSEDLLEALDKYDSFRGPLTYIAIAGGTDALSGVSSWITINPVVSCPPDFPNDSCTGNPRGSSNVTVKYPENAAKHIAQMYSSLNNDYEIILLNKNNAKIVELVEKGLKISAQYNSFT